MTSYLDLAFTGLIALFTVLIWRTYSRLNWLVGAQASHSNLMLQLEAAKADIELVWWDPSIEPFPVDGAHRQRVDRTKIYIGLPERLRKSPATYRESLARWASGGLWVWPKSQ